MQLKNILKVGKTSLVFRKASKMPLLVFSVETEGDVSQPSKDFTRPLENWGGCTWSLQMSAKKTGLHGSLQKGSSSTGPGYHCLGSHYRPCKIPGALTLDQGKTGKALTDVGVESCMQNKENGSYLPVFFKKQIYSCFETPCIISSKNKCPWNMSMHDAQIRSLACLSKSKSPLVCSREPLNGKRSCFLHKNRFKQ